PDIRATDLIAGIANSFALAPQPFNVGRLGTGFWSPLATRSAQIHGGPSLANVSDAFVLRPPLGLAPGLIANLIKRVREAQPKAAAESPFPIDRRLVRVQDYRRNAQPASLGHSPDNSGPDQAGWWIDIEEDPPAALRQLYLGARGANIHLPDKDNL